MRDYHSLFNGDRLYYKIPESCPDGFYPDERNRKLFRRTMPECENLVMKSKPCCPNTQVTFCGLTDKQVNYNDCRRCKDASQGITTR